jgi:O-antigen ligase
MVNLGPAVPWWQRHVGTMVNGHRPPGPMAPAVLALAVFAFVAIGRAAEAAPGLRLALVTGGIAIALAVMRPRQPGPSLFRLPEVRAVLALLALGVASIPLSVWPGGSLEFIVGSYIKVVAFFLMLVYVIRSPRDAVVMVWGGLTAALFLEVTTLWGAQAQDSYDRNDTALVMICALPLAASQILARRGVRRWVAAVVAALAVGTVIHGGSRGGFLGLLIVGCIIVLRMPAGRGMTRIGFLASVVILFVAFGSAGYWDRMATIWGGGGELGPHAAYDREGFSSRSELWKFGFDLMLQHPLLGVGAGAYSVAEGLSHGGQGKWEAAHNSFLQVGAELGFGGLALLIFLIYRAIRTCRALRRSPAGTVTSEHLLLVKGVEISLYGFVIVGFALSHGYSFILYFLLGMAVALGRLGTQATTVPASAPARQRTAARPAWRSA